MAFKLDNIPKQSAKKGVSLSELLQKDVVLFSKPFSNKQKEDFYTELAVLLQAGITLKEGLSLIVENQKKKELRELLNFIVDGLVSGQHFSEVLKGRKEFTEYEYHSLHIGEETGTLPKICEELGKFYARKNEQRRNLINAMTYPIIILVTAGAVVVFMLRMVVPMFQDIFKQNNVELPGITKVIISASDFLGSYGWIVLILVFFLVVFRKFYINLSWYKKYKDNFVLKIPFFGDFVKLIYTAQFTKAVGLLTSSKVPIINSIQLVKKMIDFHPLQVALDEVEYGVMQGENLSQSLKKSELFDSKMISLVKVAEETNKMEFIFNRLSHQYNIQIQQKSKMLATVLEPIIILVVGVLVGVILIAMYLPMFKLSTVLG